MICVTIPSAISGVNAVIALIKSISRKCVYGRRDDNNIYNKTIASQINILKNLIYKNEEADRRKKNEILTHVSGLEFEETLKRFEWLDLEKFNVPYIDF